MNCTIDDCSKPVVARTWCREHYNRWHAHGDPRAGAQRATRCVICKAEIQGNAGRRYCGTSCRARASYLAKKASGRYEQDLAKKRDAYIPRTPRETTPPVICATPGCERTNKARSMCGMHYHQWERGQGKHTPSDAWSPRRQAHWRKRAAKRRGATVVETIYHESIFIRDHYMCALCGEPVDKTLTHPDPMSASLDHRVPIALGGTHTRDNVQCTHLACNLAKGKADPRVSLA